MTKLLVRVTRFKYRYTDFPSLYQPMASNTLPMRRSRLSESLCVLLEKNETLLRDGFGGMTL